MEERGGRDLLVVRTSALDFITREAQFKFEFCVLHESRGVAVLLLLLGPIFPSLNILNR
jgi:hypothetical protein